MVTWSGTNMSGFRTNFIFTVWGDFYIVSQMKLCSHKWNVFWIFWKIVGISLRVPQNGQTKNVIVSVFSEAILRSTFYQEFRICLRK